MAYNPFGEDVENFSGGGSSEEERKRRLAMLANLATGGSFSGAMENYATDRTKDVANTVDKAGEFLSNPQQAIEDKFMGQKQPQATGPVMPQEIAQQRAMPAVQQPAQPQAISPEQLQQQQQVAQPAQPQIPQAGPPVQVASTQPSAGVQEAAAAAQQAAQQQQQAPDWHDKLVKGGFNELTQLIQDPNSSEEIKTEAKDRLYKIMNDQRMETKANQTINSAYSGDNKAMSDLTREMRSNKEEGSVLKAMLYSRLGLGELAKDEQRKLGAGQMYSSVMMPGGEHYTVKQGSNGLITKAYDKSGKAVSEETLANLNANYLGKKGAETGKQLYKAPNGDIYTFSTVAGQPGGIYTNSSTGEQSSTAPKGIMPLSYQNPLEKAAISAGKQVMDKMRNEVAKAKAQGAPSPYTEEDIQQAGDAASSALLSGRGGMGAVPGHAPSQPNVNAAAGAPGVTGTQGVPVGSTGLSENLMKKVSSGNRSTTEQQALYDESVNAGRPGKTAQGMPIAKPGTSQHEQGNALDIPPSKLTKDDRLELAKAGWYQPHGTDSVHWEHTGGAGGATKAPAAAAPASKALSSALEAQAQAIANGDAKAPSGMGAQNYRNRAVMDRVYAINPQFDATKYDAKAKAQKDFTTGKQGDTVRSMNVSIDHLDSLGDAAKALQNGQIPVFNKVANEYAKQTGQKAPTDFDGMKTIVGAEVAKAIQGGATALGDREEIRIELDNARSPEQLAGLITKYQKLMGGQLTGLRTQYEDAGLKDFDKKLNDRTKKVLGSGQTEEKKNTRSSW